MTTTTNTTSTVWLKEEELFSIDAVGLGGFYQAAKLYAICRSMLEDVGLPVPDTQRLLFCPSAMVKDCTNRTMGVNQHGFVVYLVTEDEKRQLFHLLTSAQELRTWMAVSGLAPWVKHEEAWQDPHLQDLFEEFFTYLCKC